MEKQQNKLGILFEELIKPFPIEAYKIDKSRGFPLTSLDAQWIKERLNRVFGIFGWQFEEHFVKINEVVIAEYKDKSTGKIMKKDEKLSGIICHGKLIIKAGDISRDISATGGCTYRLNGQNLSDVYKSAATESLSKCCSYIGIGNEMYKGNVPCEGLDKPRGDISNIMKRITKAKTPEDKQKLIIQIKACKWEKEEYEKLKEALGG